MNVILWAMVGPLHIFLLQNISFLYVKLIVFNRRTAEVTLPSVVFEWGVHVCLLVIIGQLAYHRGQIFVLF